VGDGADGWPAEKILGGAAIHGCSFRDIVFLPPMQVSSQEADKLHSRFSKNISLPTPIVGACGPSVTEERMAVALALAGGIGIIHRHQSIEEQAAMVKRVKEHETAFNLNPTTLGPRATVADAERVMREVGCSCVPVTDNGRMGGRLIGLITRRDLDSLLDGPNAAEDTPLNTVMIKDVVMAFEPITYRDAETMMRTKKVGKLPVVNSERELVALICRGDSKRSALHPHASRDPNAQLLVAAALSVDEEAIGDGLGWDRARALVDAGVDALLLETDDGVSEATLAFLKRLKATFLTTDVICGRISSVHQAEELCKDCDGLIVGAPADPRSMAPSSASSAGIAEASVLFQVARFARLNGVPVIADGGVYSAQDVVKAFCLGASAVAPGPLLARTSDSPGEVAYRNGVRIKLRRAPARASQVGAWALETVEGAVVDAGSVEDLMPYLVRCVKEGLKSLGLKSLADVHPSLASGALRLELQRALTLPAPAGRGGGGQPPALLQVRRLTTSSLFNRW